MKRESLVRQLTLLVFGGLSILATACADEPLAPPSDAGHQLSGAAAPEEEIFGIVYNNRVRTTSAGFVVRLQEASPGACIYVFTTATPNCLGSQTMAVNPTGIRPGGATSNMWGWYNNLDTDINPCNNGSHSERHDENRDGIPDSGTEKHCVKPGKYIVTLLNGAVTRTRTIDHRLGFVAVA